LVPDVSQWESLQACVQQHVTEHALVPPLSFEELEAESETLLSTNRLPYSYREFLMVLLNNTIWQQIVAEIPMKRRTLLLPPCLRSSRHCNAEFDEYGLLGEQCGNCDIGKISASAEKLG